MVFRLTHGTRASCPSAGHTSFGKQLDQRQRHLVVFGLRAAIGEGHRKRPSRDSPFCWRQAPPTGTDLSISLLAIRLAAFLFLSRPSFRSILSAPRKTLWQLPKTYRHSLSPEQSRQPCTGAACHRTDVLCIYAYLLF